MKRSELNILSEEKSVNVLKINISSKKFETSKNTINLNEKNLKLFIKNNLYSLHVVIIIISWYWQASKEMRKWISELLKINYFQTAKFVRVLKENNVKKVYYSDYMIPAFQKAIACRIVGVKSYHYNRSIPFSEPDYASIIFADTKILFSKYECGLEKKSAASYCHEYIKRSKRLKKQSILDKSIENFHKKIIVTILMKIIQTIFIENF